MTFLSLETPRPALVLQPHSTVSNLSPWLCSILRPPPPMRSLLSTNVLWGTYISRNNRGEEQVGACYCTWKKEESWANLVSFAQLAAEIKEKTESLFHPLIVFFILLFAFFIPPLAGIVRLSILTRVITEHPEWQMEILTPTGAYASSWYSGDTFQSLSLLQSNADVESSARETGAVSQCVVSCRDILSHPK